MPPLLHLEYRHELPRRHDTDTSISPQIQEMMIATDEVVGATFHSALEDSIIIGVILNHFQMSLR